MKYKRLSRPQDGVKSMVITCRKCDRESTSVVYKSFRYIAQLVDEINAAVPAPEIFIRKSIDNKSKNEKFRFHVKGYFYLTHLRMNYKINFEHTLRIHIYPKSKDFSPKKSEVLTE